MKLVSFIASLFIRTLRATLRIRHIDAQNLEHQPQYILAFWHAHLLLMLHSRYRKPISVMISQSKDGEYIARVFDWYGVDAVRGSSTRGGTAALRELLREARAGKNIVFTPDGPKGPARVAKDGVVYAARATGLPIVPVAFAAQKKNFSAHGTAWSSRCRSRKRSSCTDRRSSCRVTVTSRRGAGASSRR
ncbi:MAG: lysophospholipid acyltransferase family protein [Acidobacteria bacterium]|nr:lysophospholipid acyltransferase family protein [Acidobacteriota bacterium]MBV9474558.1 lysophospholipid acyltransferase family protein [Acidobacteriota bacterium]